MSRVFRRIAIAVLVCWWLGCGSGRMPAQSLHSSADSRRSTLRQAMLDILPSQANIPAVRAQKECIVLPIQPANDRLQGPHGNSLVSTRCEVMEYQALGRPLNRWILAHYRWTSLFTAEDQTRGPDARDTVTEEEAVLFEAPAPEQVRAVWHERIETGDYGVWRSITPEVAPTRQGTTLLSVMTCLNGTGGCSQEFLQRHADGRWYGVQQDWLDQLPGGFIGRIRHGVRIDPQSLRGEAGYYGDRDPNCCPSQRLVVELQLRGDSLVLGRQTVIAEP
ncbi:MAG TPA: hypothetical protein VGQ49_19220 [Bryobacteraceae bacterium]|nr:hypothetical protein [Bryobacteraceae bacterium]